VKYIFGDIFNIGIDLGVSTLRLGMRTTGKVIGESIRQVTNVCLFGLELTQATANEILYVVPVVIDAVNPFKGIEKAGEIEENALASNQKLEPETGQYGSRLEELIRKNATSAPIHSIREQLIPILSSEASSLDRDYPFHGQAKTGIINIPVNIPVTASWQFKLTKDNLYSSEFHVNYQGPISIINRNLYSQRSMGVVVEDLLMPLCSDVMVDLPGLPLFGTGKKDMSQILFRYDVGKLRDISQYLFSKIDPKYLESGQLVYVPKNQRLHFIDAHSVFTQMYMDRVSKKKVERRSSLVVGPGGRVHNADIRIRGDENCTSIYLDGKNPPFKQADLLFHDSQADGVAPHQLELRKVFNYGDLIVSTIR